MKPLRFIHIEKSGGSSVSKYLTDNNVEFLMGKNFKRVKKHMHAMNFINEESFKFCLVRDPYERAVSFYHYNGKAIFNCSFEDFVKHKLQFNRLTPQVMKIYHVNTDTWREDQSIREREKSFNWEHCLVDKIFKLENLNELTQFFNIKNNFPQENKGNYDRSINYYTDELKEIVYDYFQKDFEILGYKK